MSWTCIDAPQLVPLSSVGSIILTIIIDNAVFFFARWEVAESELDVLMVVNAVCLSEKQVLVFGRETEINIPTQNHAHAPTHTKDTWDINVSELDVLVAIPEVCLSEKQVLVSEAWLV
jgi:hypothetical protein